MPRATGDRDGSPLPKMPGEDPSGGQSATEAEARAAVDRVARVEALREQVRNGTYQVPVEELARKLLGLFRTGAIADEPDERLGRRG